MNEFEGPVSCSQTGISLASMKTTFTSGSFMLLKNVFFFIFNFYFSLNNNAPFSMLTWGASLILGLLVLSIPF